jgi:hypothetical protein
MCNYFRSIHVHLSWTNSVKEVVLEKEQQDSPEYVLSFPHYMRCEFLMSIIVQITVF